MTIDLNKAFPEDAPLTSAPHKSAGEAHAELNYTMGNINRDTKHRKKREWIFLMSDDPIPDVCRRMGQRADAPTRVKMKLSGITDPPSEQRVVAIWCGFEPEPTHEPEW